MLNTKFQENRSHTFREDFFKCFTIYGRGCYQDHLQNLHFHSFQPNKALHKIQL